MSRPQRPPPRYGSADTMNSAYESAGTNTILTPLNNHSARSLLLKPSSGSLQSNASRRQKHLNALNPWGDPSVRPMPSPGPSPGERQYAGSAMSRRSSWNSDNRALSPNPFDSRSPSRASSSPFDDSRAPSRADSDPEALNSQTITEKYTINPSAAGLLLFPEDVEKDDYLHNPDVKDKERGCDMFSRRALVNVGGLAFMTLGIAFLFIGYPILTFYHRFTDTVDPCAGNPLCIRSGDNSLLKNIRTGLIDPHTPQSAYTRTNADGTVWDLVFSDEFQTPGRTFYPGDDPYWEAVDIWYGATEDLEWYDPDAATTRDGYLDIQFDGFASHNLEYRSAMLQSWNKICFQGGRLEATMSLPGPGGTSGFWPGWWAMGNLGRPGYLATTDGMWPYSYHDKCDAGITPNQSSTDGISLLPGMRLPACTCGGADHPSPGRSRSAPEIDALEGSAATLGPGASNPIGVVSQSAQFAPFDIWYQPDYNFLEMYNPAITQMNSYRGGVYQQAMSGVSTLNNDWYDNNAYQAYSFAYTPGGVDGQITWYIGDEPTWKMTGDSIGPNGNVGQRMITSEPMSLVLNFGMSPTFAGIDHAQIAKVLPAHLRVASVRIYQDPNKKMVSCDPPGYPTTDYIARHSAPYMNANMTKWSQAGFSRPKNTFMDTC